MGRRICLSKPCFLLWDSQASFSYLSHMKTNPLTLYVALRLVLSVVIKRIEKFVKGSLLLKHMVEGIFFIY